MLNFNLKYWGFIKDPIYGYIHITEEEKNLIDTKEFQRLHRIRQLPLADIVYPAAVHTRFEHCLGTMYLANLYANAIPVEVKSEENKLIRFASLLHDIGHGPFSNLFEPILIEKLKMDHEQVGKQIIIQSEIADKLNLYGFNPKEVGEIITGESTKIKKYLSQIIKSGLDADKLDFIKRDNFHSGAGYGNIDIERLVTTMEIHNDELAINMTALYTFELFILSRIKSFEAIYFHKTLRAAQILLLKALRITIDELGLLNNFNVYEYLNLDDYRLWYLISSSKDGGKILSRLESRDLIKCALEVKIIGKIDSKDFSKMIEEIKYEISKKANIDETLIYFDLSSLPSVPYHNAYEHDPYEIPVIKDDMIKKVYKLSDVSSWINNLKTLINIFRIYTEKEYKEKVYEASKNVLKNYSLFEELL